MSAAESSVGTTYYVYNALGELIEKSGTGGTMLLVYDESGHLLGECTSAGVIVQETIWMGDLPVATLRPSGSSVAVYYVHTDHLGAVRKVTRPSDNGLMWRWDPDTFGSSTSSPDQNPSGLGTFTYNLRFPGQYYLSESGLFYNYYRTYDPAMGRYIEADPTGLKGGINPYAYVSNNPLWYIDRFGLTQCDIDVARRIAAATQTDLTFPDSYGSFDLGLDDRGNRIAARTISGTGTILSDYYQQVLTNAQAGELLDTIIHEAVHFTLPANDPRQDDNSGQGYAYSEALKRTTEALKGRFNKERMDCPCEANQAP